MLKLYKYIALKYILFNTIFFHELKENVFHISDIISMQRL